MMTSSGKYICDAEQRNGSACQARASWARESAYGGTLHYCEKHKDRAISPTPHHFTPKPGSVATQIIT